MIAYKLFKTRKDGSIGPLYINAKQRVPIGEWVDAEAHETKGFAFRPGWHCTSEPVAPHIAPKPNRKWFKVEINDFTPFERPEHQGGLWYLAKKMRVIEPV
jgi:hypothetical protein